MIAIPNFSPKDGLYQIDHGKIHKYKAKGGTVRAYDLIDIVRCGECKKVDTKQCPMYSAGWGYTDDDWCSCGERRYRWSYIADTKGKTESVATASIIKECQRVHM